MWLFLFYNYIMNLLIKKKKIVNVISILVVFKVFCFLYLYKYLEYLDSHYVSFFCY